MTGLGRAQRDQLLKAINSNRVGKDRKNNSHVEAYEIRAHLNRIFDFAGWSQRVLAMELIFEQQFVDESKGKDKDRVTVAYRAHVELALYDHDTHEQLAAYSEWAMGDAQNFPLSSRGDAHDFAIKTAESQGLKRCATNLGDQFGLSLYRKGSVQALVGRTVFDKAPAAGEKKTADGPSVDGHIDAPLPAESETPDDQRETNPKKATEQPRATPEAPAADGEHVAAVASLRDRALGAPEDASAPFFARLQMEAAKAGLMKALTDDGAGNVLTLGALIQQVAQARKNKAA